ncbi:rust resistance kinase Lr10-like [Andrographis paniculata]|uniref:rust resistance kinase Lr10-like n=1 Tax=Andrographis paniculata TaxID=175694 RepID=UPI0021E9A8E1|nr:rust resistance kinase Lr10-like [Andrographis paniculata]
MQQTSFAEPNIRESMPAANSLLFPISRTFILLLFLSLNNSAGYCTSFSSLCPVSSCGNISFIMFPFRLKTESCVHSKINYIELDCHNNQTSIHPSSGSWYYVQDINYTKFSIRLIEPGINRKNLSSCPLYSSVSADWHSANYFSPLHGLSEFNAAVAFIHCLSPVNSVTYVKAPFCGKRRNIFANSSQPDLYSYVVVGKDLQVSDLEESCTVDAVVWGPLSTSHNLSLPRIYDSLAYGFELQFYDCYFTDCKLVRNVLAYSGVALGVTVVVVFLASRFLMFVIGFSFLTWLVVRKWKRRHLSMDKNIEEFLQSHQSLAPIEYTYKEIKKMTHNFSVKLGEGGFGIVYKGKLRSGPYVAIKMMEASMASEEDFMNEVGSIGRIHHVNVVRLIGFCVEYSKYALVYEFLPNGSLDRYLFNQQSPDVLVVTLDKMFEIALGVARGISYLHYGCNFRILHFDIKPHNILLDDKFNPKISDFGLAQIHPTNERFTSVTAGRVRGTIGYMAPEMYYNNMGGISYKADVYSFGMMLMEMASRRKNMNLFAEDTSQIYFPSWVYDQLSGGKNIHVSDGSEEEKLMVKKIIIVALWCIQQRPSDRPSMDKVMKMLEGDSELRMPPRPFAARRGTDEDDGRAPTYSVQCIDLDLAEN